LWISFGATFFRPVRGFLERPRAKRSARAVLMLSAAFISLSGGTPKQTLMTKYSAEIENETDLALQRAATAALEQRDGAIVIMDAQTGRVRASVNLEGAYTQAMMPGSTMKPFTTLAALRSGLIDEDSRTTCPGRFTGLSFSLPCVHADHLPPFTPS